MWLATDPEAERAQHEESQYQQCLSWIKQQSGDFRSRLVKDLAEWEKTLPTESQSSDPQMHILEPEIFRTEWGEVTEYVMPESGIHGSFRFRAPDGRFHSHRPGVSHYDVAISGASSWYFVACRQCRRCVVTFPDCGGSWPKALRHLGWQAAKKWANAYCPACSRS